MKLHENCLPCLINQTIKTVHMTEAKDPEFIYRTVFEMLSHVDFNTPAPKVYGDIYAMIRQTIGIDDPYAQIRRDCNRLMLSLKSGLSEQILKSEHPFRQAVIDAILGNIIDYSASGELTGEAILNTFSSANEREPTIDQIDELETACKSCQKILYIGDNCGEIVADALLMELMRKMNPAAEITFAVRGFPVVNDVILSDAEECGLSSLARIIDTADTSQGAVLPSSGEDFQQAFQEAELIIAKGQGNYEGLTECPDSRIFCLLMAKCAHIAQAIGVPVGSLAVLRLQEDTY